LSDAGRQIGATSVEILMKCLSVRIAMSASKFPSVFFQFLWAVIEVTFLIWFGGKIVGVLRDFGRYLWLRMTKTSSGGVEKFDPLKQWAAVGRFLFCYFNFSRYFEAIFTAQHVPLANECATAEILVVEVIKE
jgi:hypothetical protein